MPSIKDLEANIEKLKSDYQKSLKSAQAELKKQKLKEREAIVKQLGNLFYDDYQKSDAESPKIFHDDCIYAVEVYQKNWEDNEATCVASSSSNFENQKATFGLPEANIF